MANVRRLLTASASSLVTLIFSFPYFILVKYLYYIITIFYESLFLKKLQKV